jgi:hypothetical protein
VDAVATSKPPAIQTNARPTSPVRLAAIALSFAIATGLVFGAHPASLTFWDFGRSRFWKELYLPGERARQFATIADLIPPSARVASTDFVHPRYTHFERSYDYSDYVRQVAGYADRVPDDTDYIVIDTQHPYSRVRSLREVIPNDSQGYFIVLKRKRGA